MNRELKQYFTEMQQIQDQHMEAIAAEPFDLDTDRMLFERKRAFENLRNAMSTIPVSMRHRFHNEAAKIREKDEQFKQRLQERKQELLQRLNRNAKGKQLLKGYRGSSRQALRFMDTTG